MINIGVIGYGYWGPNLVRNFTELPTARVEAVCDLQTNRLAPLPARYPGIKITADYRDVLANPAIDAVVIATPVSTHFDLALQAVQSGKHVLVEKPLCTTSEQAERLIEEAGRRGLVLMVDHTFVYTGAVRKIRDMVSNDDLGHIYYYDSVRVNLGLFQHDVNVIWDLAVHDLSIMDFVLPNRPCAVSATGMSHVRKQPENIAYLTVFFESQLMAHIHVNWLAPVKLRRTLIGGSRKMIVYDDLEPSEKIKVYDKGIDVSRNSESARQMQIGYRTGDMWAPHLDHSEALRTETAHFVECVQGVGQPITDGQAGLRTVQLLEAATRSMMQRGRLVELPRMATPARTLQVV